MSADNYVPGKPLYHYTDLAALKTILTTGCFRLSGLSHLRQNDRREIEYGIAVLKEIVSTYRAHPGLQEHLRRTLLEFFTWERFTRDFDCYIGCFAANAEDALLWQRFGRAGQGIAIGVKPSYFEIREPVPGVRDFVLQPVIYHRAELEMRMQKALDAAMAQLEKGRQHLRTHRDRVVLIAEISRQIMAGFLIPLCIIAKAPEFNVETEVRAILISAALDRGDAPRPDFAFVDLQAKDVGDTLLWPRRRSSGGKVGLAKSPSWRPTPPGPFTLRPRLG